jgi:hypothetical protein
MGQYLDKETGMSARPSQRLVREGDLVAEVNVMLEDAVNGWAPYLSVADASKLDDVRDALRTGDLKAATQLSNRVYRLTPIEG